MAQGLLPPLMTETETLEVFGVLAIAIGFAGAAILLLFAKKKI